MFLAGHVWNLANWHMTGSSSVADQGHQFIQISGVSLVLIDPSVPRWVYRLKNYLNPQAFTVEAFAHYRIKPSLLNFHSEKEI